MKARSYDGLHDLHAMLDLLSQGCRANIDAHYVHRGDLQWWLFYTDIPQEVWAPNIRLWFEDERLIGWASFALEEKAFDVFTHPDLRGTPREQEMLAWSLEQMSSFDEFQMMWVAENDDVRIGWLEGNGFEPDSHHFVYFSRSLAGPLDAARLPDEYSLRTSRGEEDAKIRSMTSRAAFGSTKPFEEYWPRTLRFMQSPVYEPEHEIFVMAPNGDVASYCIVWTDERNRLGHFEPVGTHPDYQRKGLGKALLLDALCRLKAEGMTDADVCTNHDNHAAIRLYESVGFQLDKRLLTFTKRNKS